MNNKPHKSQLEVYEEHPLVYLYIGDRESFESEMLLKVHKDWLPAMLAKLKEVLEK